MVHRYGAHTIEVSIETNVSSLGRAQPTPTIVTMLNSTYTWGTAPNNLTFVKLFGDAGKAPFAVQGLTPSTARTMTVSHQPAANGAVRSMIRVDRTDPVAGSPVGATKRSSAYIVLASSAEQSDAERRYMLDHLKAALSDAAFVTAFLNGEA